MSQYDIIPDIHGHSQKLDSLLGQLGYAKRRGRWHHDDRDRQIVFLGDFIDRGPDSGGVLETVRDLIADGRALAVMGNHELNAVHFHNDDPERGTPLRPHTDKNRQQHAAFLAQFPHGSAGAREWTDWMAGLPLWLDLGPFRVVHACWHRDAIRRLARIAPGGVLERDRLLKAGRHGDPLHEDVETLTKGPEHELGSGEFVSDKEGNRRSAVRIAWWKPDAATWDAATVSAHAPMRLPDGPPPAAVTRGIYPPDQKPVFFGHYWLEGDPRIEAANALCLDYSAGIGENPLLAYAWHPELPGLELEAIVGGRQSPTTDEQEVMEHARMMRDAWEKMGSIAVKFRGEAGGWPEYAVAVGNWTAEGPVVIYHRKHDHPGLPEADTGRTVASYRSWAEAAAAGWRAD